jgi:DUF4097 and DUF4098 domain-containing protein YvlB
MTAAAPTTVRISAGNHGVAVVAAAGRTFQLNGEATVDEVGDQITISRPESKLQIFVPPGTNLVIGTTSGRIGLSGPLGHVAVVTESGKVEVESAESVDIRTRSSRVEVGRVAGLCRVRSTSGKVEIGSCGDADIAGESGRIELQRVAGSVEAHSVSGRIELSMASANDVTAETVTGRIEVSLPKGSVAYQPAESELGTLRPPECDCTVVARSTTGKVVVTSR